MLVTVNITHTAVVELPRACLTLFLTVLVEASPRNPTGVKEGTMQ